MERVFPEFIVGAEMCHLCFGHILHWFDISTSGLGLVLH